jgi:hypothetical protein
MAKGAGQERDLPVEIPLLVPRHIQADIFFGILPNHSAHATVDLLRSKCA